jgi:ankyrin repeat protein
MTTLLDNGADIHAVDDEGNTPLHMAAFFLQYRAAELLGKRGANIDARNRFDQAPIVLSEDATMIRLLKV